MTAKYRNMTEEERREFDFDVQAFEVAWYRANGRFPRQRIRRDAFGREYMIGDQSWNAGRAGMEREEVEPRLAQPIRVARLKYCAGGSAP